MKIVSAKNQDNSVVSNDDMMLDDVYPVDQLLDFRLRAMIQTLAHATGAKTLAARTYEDLDMDTDKLLVLEEPPVYEGLMQ